MTPAQLSRLESNRAILLSVLLNLMELAKETHNEVVLQAASKVRCACERIEEANQ